MMRKGLLFSSTASGAVRSAMARVRKDEDNHDGPLLAVDPVEPKADPVDPAPKDPADPVDPKADPVDPNADPEPKDPADPAEPEKKDPAEEDTVPEAYADFTIPDGMEIDKDMLEAFLPQFKEQGLTQKQAQERVNDAAKLATHWQQKAIEGFEQTTKGWREAIKTDPAYGGEKLGETLALGKRVIDTFGADDAELKEVIDSYRLGDNPGFIRLMARVGGAISEDVFVAGGKARAAPSLTDTLYPTMKKKD